MRPTTPFSRNSIKFKQFPKYKLRAKKILDYTAISKPALGFMERLYPKNKGLRCSPEVDRELPRLTVIPNSRTIM